MATSVKIDFKHGNRLDRLARGWLDTWGAEDVPEAPECRA